eukprot:8117-Heterococcus_DN1.PRE.8
MGRGDYHLYDAYTEVTHSSSSHASHHMLANTVQTSASNACIIAHTGDGHTRARLARNSAAVKQGWCNRACVTAAAGAAATATAGTATAHASSSTGRSRSKVNACWCCARCWCRCKCC